MSLPRSIDRADLGGATVTLVTTTETVVLVGPALQTPKDTSTVVVHVGINITLPASATSVVFRIRTGTTVAGSQLGQSYTEGLPPAAQTISAGFMVSYASNFTDYSQVVLTAQQVGASANATVTAATLLAISF